MLRGRKPVSFGFRAAVQHGLIQLRPTLPYLADLDELLVGNWGERLPKPLSCGAEHVGPIRSVQVPPEVNRSGKIESGV